MYPLSIVSKFNLAQVALIVLLIVFGWSGASAQTIAITPEESLSQILDHMVLRDPDALQFDEGKGALQGDMTLGGQVETYPRRAIPEGSWLGVRLVNTVIGAANGGWIPSLRFGRQTR